MLPRQLGQICLAYTGDIECWIIEVFEYGCLDELLMLWELGLDSQDLVRNNAFDRASRSGNLLLIAWVASILSIADTQEAFYHPITLRRFARHPIPNLTRINTGRGVVIMPPRWKYIINRASDMFWNAICNDCIDTLKWLKRQMPPKEWTAVSQSFDGSHHTVIGHACTAGRLTIAKWLHKNAPSSKMFSVSVGTEICSRGYMNILCWLYERDIYLQKPYSLNMFSAACYADNISIARWLNSIFTGPEVTPEEYAVNRVILDHHAWSTSTVTVRWILSFRPAIAHTNDSVLGVRFPPRNAMPSALKHFKAIRAKKTA